MNYLKKYLFFSLIFLKKNKKKDLQLSKNKGSVLLISILLSGMILSIGASAAKILIKEIEFTSDLVFAEKSYFAAESGVEIALLELKKHPVRNIVNQEILLNNGTISSLNIENRIDEFEINLPKNGNTKFRLKKQTNENDPLGMTIINVEKTTNFLVKNPEKKKFHWKVLCQKNKKTVAIQNDHENILFDSNAEFGIFENEDGNVSQSSSLDNFLQNNDYQNCFFSFENLEDTEIKITLNAPQKTAPNKAKITAIGKSGNREKCIVFDYAQKNLGSLFDFVFFHSDEGI